MNNLPMYPLLTEWEQNQVISAIQAVVNDDFFQSKHLNLREHRATDSSAD
jgi:hypothetical protein